MIKRACGTLRLSRAMVFRLLPGTRKIKGQVLCFHRPQDESLEPLFLTRSRNEFSRHRSADFYLTRERRPVAALHRDVAADCAKSRLRIPSYGSVLRRLQAFDPRTLVSKREGPQRAREQFRSLASNLLTGLQSTRYWEKQSTR